MIPVDQEGGGVCFPAELQRFTPELFELQTFSFFFSCCFTALQWL